MRAKKANKVYVIDENQKKFYQEAGYDIVGDDGKIIAYGRGKTVPYGEYAAAVDEKKALEEQLAEIEPADDEDVKNILASYAAEHGIDLGRANTVSGIVKKIKEHQQEAGE